MAPVAVVTPRQDKITVLSDRPLSDGERVGHLGPQPASGTADIVHAVDFWAVVATTVPVLALALTVQSREDMLRNRNAPPFFLRIGGFTNLYGFVLAMIIEYVALDGLAHGREPSAGAKSVAQSGMMLLFFSVVSTPIMLFAWVAFAGTIIRAKAARLVIETLWFEMGLILRNWRARLVLRQAHRQVGDATLKNYPTLVKIRGTPEGIECSEILQRIADRVDFMSYDLAYWHERHRRRLAEIRAKSRSASRDRSMASLRAAIADLARTERDSALQTSSNEARQASITQEVADAVAQTNP